MELILWRHAEAEDAYPDISRALSTKGQKQAANMAAWLKPQLPTDIRILASPAKRTQQTASALGISFETIDLIAPGASAETLLEVAAWPQNEQSILIVGHQPTLGLVAALAMTGEKHDWSIKKGAVWWISSRIRESERQSVLRAVMSPEQL